MADPQYIYRRLQEHGFSPEFAAGILGNVQQESSFDPTSLNTPEGAYGLMQWRGPRRDALEAYARSQGLPSSDLDVQIGNIARESREEEAANYARAQGGGGTPGDYARRFAQYVERPGDVASYGQRAQYANNIYGGGGGLGYASPGYVDSGGGTNPNVFGAPDPDVPAQPVEGYRTQRPNPFAVTEPGIMFEENELAGEALPQTMADVPSSQDPYRSGKAQFGDQLIRTLNPLNLIGTALSLPLYLGAGMRNAVRGAVGLPSDYENLRAKGDLYEQALNAYGEPVERHGYGEPAPFGRGTSPIADVLGNLVGANLGDVGREQERIRNLKNLYDLTGIRSSIENQQSSREYRQVMTDLALGRYGMAEAAHRWKTPIGEGPYAGMTRGAAAKEGFTQGRFDTGRKDRWDRFNTTTVTDPLNPDFGQPRSAVAGRALTERGQDIADADRDAARENARVQTVLDDRIKALNEQHKKDRPGMSIMRSLGLAGDLSGTAEIYELTDKQLPEQYRRGKAWWYKDDAGKPTVDERYRSNGITTFAPEQPKKVNPEAGTREIDPDEAAAVGGIVAPPPPRSYVPDAGPNLAEGQTVIEGGGRTRQAYSDDQEAKAMQMVKDRAAELNARDPRKYKTWDQMSKEERTQRKAEALNRLYPK